MSTDWPTIEIVVFSALGLLVALLLALGLMTRIRYRIGSRAVKVLLFGVCIRRVPFKNIDSISKRRGEGWAENWWSTLRPKHRMLVIRRKRGLFKNFVLTPKNRYVFRNDLERAMRRAGHGLSGSSRGEELEAGAPEPANSTSADPRMDES